MINLRSQASPRPRVRATPATRGSPKDSAFHFVTQAAAKRSPATTPNAGVQRVRPMRRHAIAHHTKAVMGRS